MAVHFTKKNFKSLVDNGHGGSAVKDNDGYEFTAFAIDGDVLCMCVVKDGGKWNVIDPRTGLRLCDGKTREEAAKNATQPKMVMYFANLYRSEQYTEMVDKFLRIVTHGAVEQDAPKKDAPKPKAPKAPKKRAAKPKSTKPKAPAKPKKQAPKEQDELAKALAELAKVNKELDDLKNGKLDEMIAAKADEIFGSVYEKISADLDNIIGNITVEQADKMADELPSEVENVAATWTIADARKWAAINGFTADQVNPERKDCIWIYGVRKDDKPMHERLTKMGLRWGGKGWYIDPKRAMK